MSQEPPRAKAAESSDDKTKLAPPDGENPNGSQGGEAQASTRPDDDSLEAILLQAGSRSPGDLQSSGGTGSGTGMNAAAESPLPPPNDILERVTSAHGLDEPKGTSLLDEVAQALSIKASEYRDRGRERLPGMPAGAAFAAPSGSSPGSNAAASAAEFEDPDEDLDGMTTAVISVVDGHEQEIAGDGQLVTEHVAAGPVAAASASAASAPPGLAAVVRVADGRSGKLPPVPGVSTPQALPAVGPPPGVPNRTFTPGTGVAAPSLGRPRLTSPAPGSPLPPLPSPPFGRVTLPPGTMMPLPGARAGGDLAATSPATPISLKAARRHSGAVTITADARRSGRVPTRGGGRVTAPVMRAATGPTLPAVLTAHVRLATINLAGLIVLTFAGGLLVGMLVSKGQGRSEPILVATPRAAGPNTGSLAAPEPAAAVEPPKANAVNAPAPVDTPAASAPPLATVPASPPASPSPPVAAPAERVGAGRDHEPVVAPLAQKPEPTGAPAETDAAPRKPLPATTRPSRPRRPATITEAAAATAPASKPVANGSAAPKPGAKAKTKGSWKDPFAD